MIASVRDIYNASFSEERYGSFLKDLDQLYNHPITFRVAESPVFVGRDLKRQLKQACEEIVDVLVRPDFTERTHAAIPKECFVPGETKQPLFLAFDYAVVQTESGLEPRLIEMQGFPSLFGWQDVLSLKYREYFDVPSDWQSHWGMNSAEYRELLCRTLLNGHSPEEVILLEIDPLKQNTAVDFLATQDITGIAPVHLGDVIREGRYLFYMRNGKKTPVRRIYNRVIFDELLKRPDVKGPYSLTDPAEVEWAGHPNWFFRVSKFTMAMVKSRFIPECRFLNQYDAWPADLENYVLKPLFSFSGSGVIFNLTREDLDKIPANDYPAYMLQRKVDYKPVIKAPDGMVKTEIRMLYIWNEGAARPQPVTNLARLSRGEMIGVKYNKDKTWVGGSVCFFEPD